MCSIGPLRRVFYRIGGVFLVVFAVMTFSSAASWAKDCRPIAEIGPSLDAGKAPLNTRVWIRLAPGNAHQFRRKGGKLSVAKLMRAISLTDLSTAKTMKFMLRVDTDAGADIVLSLRPMATFRPDQRYRVELTMSKSWNVVNDFETGAKPNKAKNPPRGDIQVDYTNDARDPQTLRVRYQVSHPKRVAPLYQVFVGQVGKARPKKPTTVEFTGRVDVRGVWTLSRAKSAKGVSFHQVNAIF